MRGAKNEEGHGHIWVTLGIFIITFQLIFWIIIPGISDDIKELNERVEALEQKAEEPTREERSEIIRKEIEEKQRELEALNEAE